VSLRKGILLRLEPALHDALARWAADEMRSTNAQIDFLLRRALANSGGCPCARDGPGPVAPLDLAPPDRQHEHVTLLHRAECPEDGHDQ